MTESDNPALLTLKVSLDDVVPAVWRRIAVPSNILLPELHNVIQDAMGWEDRHLHAFYTGDGSYEDGRRFEMRLTLEEDDDGTGICEDDVPVDRLLSQVGDNLGYQYDFGDNWEHRIVLEAIGPVGDDGVRCLDGEGACPPEDCGGVHGYADFLAVLADPRREEHEHYREWAGSFEVGRFEVAEANARIASRRELDDLSGRVLRAAPLLGTTIRRAPLEHHTLLTPILRRIDFDDTDVDSVVAGVAMEKLSWMLARIGDEGLQLTAAGYLRPVDVTALRDELDWGRDWISNSSREIDNHEVHWMRAAVKDFGLARVLKGRLVLTKDGRRLAEDPVGLWHRAAARLPVGNTDLELDAGVLLLVTVAAGCDSDERNAAIFDSLSATGWRVPDSKRPYTQYLARPTLDVLTLVGAVGSDIGRGDAGRPGWSRSLARQCLGGTPAAL
ncbi:plasmid pRiA4b ORF-3 family protein [Rhodococcoides yunnanense]|uniref:plasmid pRiA4b ORF-3 family protein n=1 Tax=Rhodococcoides yunnanense TaxID=278209 RepID=UPI00147593F0|nr:plasmid pRiA4b ORF-3 family protein [Rhodococcus yunnanensis]